jgi:hypothetical protein
MSRTYKDRKEYKWSFCERDGVTLLRWAHPGTGKWWKRQHNKAVRSWHRGTGGKEHSVLHYGRECNWKLM